MLRKNSDLYRKLSIAICNFKFPEIIASPPE